MNLDSVSNFTGKLGASLASIAKVMLLSKGASSSSDEGHERELVILGNGPSLRTTIEQDLDWLLQHDLMSLNFAALSDEFFRLRPKYYVMADSHFFNSLKSDPNVRKLWRNLEKVTWPLTLLVPSKMKHFVKPLVMSSENIKLRYFNLTPVEGFKWLNHLFFKGGLGMPRPRNVLIPAIMEGIRLGYRKIYLCGADHSWTKTLHVDDDNTVVSIQPHFYEDNEEERKRVKETYKDLRLHDVLGSMTVAFRSYWEIAGYADIRGVEIINASPGSMIDAFRRK